MKNIQITLIIVSMVLCKNLFAQDSTWTRDYTIQVHNQYDLRNSANNGLTVHRVLNDGFRKEIKPQMGTKMGNFSYGLYSFATTYLSMVWSHELGHALRARQVGGYFKIHNGELPIPYTTMHLPEDVSLTDEALSVTGGFEVNHLNVRYLQSQFIEENGMVNEDLAYAFANRLMFTIYTSLIIPINPEEKEVWIKTAGDPVHCVLPVFKNYSNNQVFMADSSVNPELVQFYQQSAIFGTFFQLLDPHFYKEVGASFGKSSKERRPFFLVGDHTTGWTYGTLFNMSPLGYELYMHNYIHLDGKQFTVYGRYGNPFKNQGVGVKWGNIVKRTDWQIGGQIELWDQDIFGAGVAAEAQTQVKLSNMFSIQASLGYKTAGYVLGKQLDEGVNAGFGLIYHAKY